MPPLRSERTLDPGLGCLLEFRRQGEGLALDIAAIAARILLMIHV